jgi:hypothetical protein
MFMLLLAKAHIIFILQNALDQVSLWTAKCSCKQVQKITDSFFAFHISRLILW